MKNGKLMIHEIYAFGHNRITVLLRAPKRVKYTSVPPCIYLCWIISSYHKRCGKFRMFLNVWHTCIPVFVLPMQNCDWFPLSHRLLKYSILPVASLIHLSLYPPQTHLFLHLSIPHFLSALFPVSCINAARWDGGDEGQWPLSGHAVWTGLLCPQDLHWHPETNQHPKRSVSLSHTQTHITFVYKCAWFWLVIQNSVLKCCQTWVKMPAFRTMDLILNCNIFRDTVSLTSANVLLWIIINSVLHIHLFILCV